MAINKAAITLHSEAIPRYRDRQGIQMSSIATEPYWILKEELCCGEIDKDFQLIDSPEKSWASDDSDARYSRANESF